jgi:hypothetical protein
MMMNVQLKAVEFDAQAARKILRANIAIRLACSRDIDNVTIVINEAEARVAKLREGLGEFATLLDQIADAASDALKNDAPLVTPPGLVEAKRRNEKLLEDIKFAEAGIVSLRAKREQLVRDLAILTTRVNEATAHGRMACGRCAGQGT